MTDLPTNEIPYAVIEVGRQVMEEMPPANKPRQTLMDSVTSAGVYMHRFKPLRPWTFEGAEQSHENCRFDLVYSHPEHGVFVDEIKTGASRHDESVIRPQIDRYVVVGQRTWQDRFIGVRVCALKAPARSKLHTHSSRKAAWLKDEDLAKMTPIR